MTPFTPQKSYGFNRAFYGLFSILLFFILFPHPALAKERSGEVTFTITIDSPNENTDTRFWIPYPVSDEYQEISNVRVEGNQSAHGIYRDSSTGNMALYAEWTSPVEERYILFAFEVSVLDRIKQAPVSVQTGVPVEVRRYLLGTKFIPVDGKVKEIADEIVIGKETTAQRARAVYDWVVENTRRDPSVKGCGTGEVEALLARRAGGKCVDISSVFVALARAAGVPAREVFGLRLGRGDQNDITEGHHCWAEFYQPGSGWIPVDPADVRKVMFLKDLELREAGAYRDYFFGAVDEYRMVLGKGGRELYLSPKINDGPLNYFMYPYAEVDGKALEWLAAQKELKYKITFKAGD